MINWEKLYHLVCERVSEEGHNHHIIPHHTGLEDETTVKLNFRNHVLAHYIRYKWLHERGDRLAVQVLTRKGIPMFTDEKEVVYKQPKGKPKTKTNSIHPQIIVISTPVIIQNIIVRKYVKMKKKTKKEKESIKKYNQSPVKSGSNNLDKKLKDSLRSKYQ